MRLENNLLKAAEKQRDGAEGLTLLGGCAFVLFAAFLGLAIADWLSGSASLLGWLR